MEDLSFVIDFFKKCLPFLGAGSIIYIVKVCSKIIWKFMLAKKDIEIRDIKTQYYEQIQERDKRHQAALEEKDKEIEKYKEAYNTLKNKVFMIELLLSIYNCKTDNKGDTS